MNLIERVGELKYLVERETQTLEILQNRQERHQHVARFTELVESSHQIRMENDANFRKLDTDEALRRRTHIINWLSATIAQVDQDHASLPRQHCSESGQWLLNDATFRDWLAPTAVSSAAIWMTGMPGSGKSSSLG